MLAHVEIFAKIFVEFVGYKEDSFMKKRILSFVLALALVLSGLPFFGASTEVRAASD